MATRNVAKKKISTGGKLKAVAKLKVNRLGKDFKNKVGGGVGHKAVCGCVCSGDTDVAGDKSGSHS